MFTRYLLFLVMLLSNLSYSQELIFQTNDPANSVWPISGSGTEDRLAASFGPRLLNGSYDYHRGLDIAETDGTPIMAVLPGIVVRVEPARAEGESLARFGNFIVIAHDDLTMADNSIKARQTAYLHLSEFRVAVDDNVSAGDTIALVGNSGVGINTYHLHFEYYINRNNGNISAGDTRHPIRLLSYTPKNKNVSVTRDPDGDSLRVIVKEHHSAIDLVRFEISTNTGIADTIDFEARIGINGTSSSTEDDNPYDGVRICPDTFTSSTDTLAREFIFDTSVNDNNNWSNTDTVYVKIYTARDQTINYTFDLNDPLPVELTVFNAILSEGQIILNWETATEICNYGFEIQRARLNQNERHYTPVLKTIESTGAGSGWVALGFVAGAGNSNSPREYSFVDSAPPPDKIQYRLKQIDTDGSYEYSETVEVSIPEIPPANFTLFQNYPNPFNPVTSISFSLKEKNYAVLKIFDAQGKEISVLYEGKLSAGTYTKQWNARGFASGIYFYRLQAGSFSETKKLLLLK